MLTIDPTAERQRIQAGFAHYQQQLEQIDQARIECIEAFNALAAENAFIARLEAAAQAAEQAAPPSA